MPLFMSLAFTGATPGWSWKPHGNKARTCEIQPSTAFSPANFGAAGREWIQAFKEGSMTGKMKRSVKPIPDGYHAVTPYLTVPGLAKTIEFLKQAFGAEVKEIMERPGGGVAHAEVKIGDSPIMMGEPDPKGPYAPRPCNLYLYVPDVDAVYER